MNLLPIIRFCHFHWIIPAKHSHCKDTCLIQQLHEDITKKLLQKGGLRGGEGFFIYPFLFWKGVGWY